MTDNQEELAVERARLGIEAEAFTRSTLGKYLLARADEESDELLEKLIKADPDDRKANTDIRNELKVLDMFRTWIHESINSGKAAEQEIDVLEAVDTE